MGILGIDMLGYWAENADTVKQVCIVLAVLLALFSVGRAAWAAARTETKKKSK
jgi:hypothetical protein